MARPDNRFTRRALGAVVALVGLVGMAAFGTAVPALAAEPATAAPAGGTTVHFRGWTTTVPSGWAVVDLTADPQACVRFDVHAVYLGTPGSAQRCPADLLGRTEAILVEPVESPSDPTPAEVISPGPAFTGVVPASSTTDEVRVAIPSAGVQVTATWNRDPAAVGTVLASGTATPGWQPTPGQRSLPGPRVATSTRVVGTKAFTGSGFDTCAAPSLSTMDAWLSSPYRAVGVYIGGNNRACSQSNLTSSWVSSVTDSGWQVMPIYVGYQAPVNICGCRSLSPSQASSQGSAAADDAVAKAKGLGMGPGSPIYFDMENYTSGSTNTPGVVSFLSSWSSRLHQLGYQSGVYGGVYSVFADLIAAGSSITLPDTIWYAVWDGRNATLGASSLSDSRWTHARIHQYSSGTDTWGGVTVDVDRNAVDTTLVGPADPAPRDPGPVLNPTVPPATVRDYIARVYWAEVNRGPTADESNFWTWLLQTGTPPFELSNALLHGEEWSSFEMSAQYLIMLRRMADPSGQQFWSAWMKANRSPDVMAAVLGSSDEYWYTAGWNPTTLVTNLYRDLLGRRPDAGGLAYWSARVGTPQGRFAVAVSLATSPERANTFVIGAYMQLLHRAPDTGGLAAFSTLYQVNRDPASVLIPLAISAEAVNLGA